MDISQSAIDMARANAVRNRLEGRMDFLTADVFDLLTELEKKGGKPYDFIILDPPAFTKSRKTVDSAERGYKEINLRACGCCRAAATSPPPRAATSCRASCLKNAALRGAGRNVELRQIERASRHLTHPDVGTSRRRLPGNLYFSVV